MSIAAIVLAGGRSARMGSPKALLDFRGQPFVVRILEALTALEVKTRVVVLGPAAPRVRAALAGQECLIVENQDVEGGPIVSLRAGLRALEAVRPAGVLAWPVDLPHVRVSTVDRLLETFRREDPRPPAVVPSFGERRGHPVLWNSATFDELLTSEAAGREGARAVLHAHAAELVTVPVDDPAVIDALNTPADYERLIREWNRDIY